MAADHSRRGLASYSGESQRTQTRGISTVHSNRSNSHRAQVATLTIE